MLLIPRGTGNQIPIMRDYTGSGEDQLRVQTFTLPGTMGMSTGLVPLLQCDTRLNANNADILRVPDPARVVDQLQIWTHFDPIERMQAKINLRHILGIWHAPPSITGGYGSNAGAAMKFFFNVPPTRMNPRSRILVQRCPSEVSLVAHQSPCPVGRAPRSLPRYRPGLGRSGQASG